MCGCNHLTDHDAVCTCICEEHKNFDMAFRMAMQRYDTIVSLQRENAQLKGHLERLLTGSRQLREALMEVELAL